VLLLLLWGVVVFPSHRMKQTQRESLPINAPCRLADFPGGQVLRGRGGAVDHDRADPGCGREGNVQSAPALGETRPEQEPAGTVVRTD